MLPQNKIHILSTRLLDETLTAKAAEYNLLIDSVSFIETKYLQDDVLTAQLHTLGAQELIAVFTSMNAVNAVAEKLVAPPHWKIYCTGGITKEYAIKFFGEHAVAATAKNATTLAEKMVAAPLDKPIVFFCGDQRLNELPETLQKNGKTIEEVVVYTTNQTPLYIEKNYDSILFFSPSAVHSFFSLNTIPTDCILFSIGQTTTATIRSYCTNRIITSEWPGKESMMEIVAGYYKINLADAKM